MMESSVKHDIDNSCNNRKTVMVKIAKEMI